MSNKGFIQKGKKTYHICLSSGNEVMFRTREDYFRGYNCYALALAKTDSVSLADAFMSNHFHIVVQTSNPSALMRSLRSSYSQYFNKKYHRQGKLGNRKYYCTAINGLYHHLAAISYVLRNPLHHGVSPTAYGYEHCSANAVFRKALGKIPYKILHRKFHYKYISRKEKSPLCYEMSENGVYLRESVTDLYTVEHMYLTPRSFDYYMNRRSGEEWRKEQDKDGNEMDPITIENIEREYIKGRVLDMDQKGDMPGMNNELYEKVVKRMMYYESGRSDYNKVTDIELCTYIDNVILPKLGKPSVYCLSGKEKINIAELIYNMKFNPSASQIRRCLVMNV